ncbi:hypothetical protein GCM10018785_21750 [Streptomyces longispororuber]|uniref:Uncharacterized protein n=1 Tax=Streptomyces longispororuber TaxID=68230 RepID=A0A919DIQ0_9ACTN|nr:hypothetical protein GCM10018785_21750 [Streptomyces longispororuber]
MEAVLAVDAEPVVEAELVVDAEPVVESVLVVAVVIGVSRSRRGLPRDRYASDSAPPGHSYPGLGPTLGLPEPGWRWGGRAPGPEAAARRPGRERRRGE